nr:hypothetical protein [Tanacetum cinerariifolium]
MDFLNAHTIQYALVVNPTIYASCIKQFWATASIKKVNDVVQLRVLIDKKKVVVSEDIIHRDLHLDNAKGVECLPNEEIFAELAQEDEVKVPTAPSPPSPTNAPSPPQQDPTSTPYATPPASRPQEQPTTTSKSSMSLLTTLLETCASLSQKVAELEQDKHTQALEILKLMKRVKKRMHPNRGKIKAIDADEDITLVDMETQEEAVTIDAEPQGRIDQEDVNVVSKGVNADEPTVFDDEEVTITMAQTLIKIKAEKARLLDE